jgi:hypothetical protein
VVMPPRMRIRRETCCILDSGGMGVTRRGTTKKSALAHPGEARPHTHASKPDFPGRPGFSILG